MGAGGSWSARGAWEGAGRKAGGVGRWGVGGPGYPHRGGGAVKVSHLFLFLFFIYFLFLSAWGGLEKFSPSAYPVDRVPPA